MASDRLETEELLGFQEKRFVCLLDGITTILARLNANERLGWGVTARMERMRDVSPKEIRLTANGGFRNTKSNFGENLSFLIGLGLLAA